MLEAVIAIMVIIDINFANIMINIIVITMVKIMIEIIAITMVNLCIINSGIINYTFF